MIFHFISYLVLWRPVLISQIGKKRKISVFVFWLLLKYWSLEIYEGLLEASWEVGLDWNCGFASCCFVWVIKNKLFLLFLIIIFKITLTLFLRLNLLLQRMSVLFQSSPAVDAVWGLDRSSVKHNFCSIPSTRSSLWFLLRNECTKAQVKGKFFSKYFSMVVF